jgi:putative lipoprotein
MTAARALGIEQCLAIVVLAGLGAACTSMPTDNAAGGAAERGQVTGTLTYRERIALRPGSFAEVWLLDTSRADAPATELAHQIIENPGAPPIPFALEYDKAQIDDRFIYSVRAVIRRGDRLLFTSDTHYPVLTRGAGDSVELLLVQANGPASKPDAPLTNTYWRLVSIGATTYRHSSDAREPFLQFRADNTGARGFTGCNSFTGSFSAANGTLDLGELAVTQRACFEGMEIEKQFIAALRTADRYAIQGDTMQLFSGADAVLGFEAVYF